jgi:hypothetical protein
MKRRLLLVVPILIFAAGALVGCGAVTCGLPCSDNSDCGGDNVCYSGECAPQKCESNCSHVGTNVCLFDTTTCTYISCE